MKLFKKKITIPISNLLTVGFGFILFISVSSILLIGFITASKNTKDLLQQKSHLLNLITTSSLRQYLDPAIDQTKFTSTLLQHIDLSNTKDIKNTLRASLAAAPQLLGVMFIDTSYTAVRVMQVDGFAFSEVRNYANDDEQIKISNEIMNLQEGSWGTPFWSDEFQDTLLNYSIPIYQKSKYKGYIGTVISIKELSKFLSKINTQKNQNSFILYGSNLVLAHPTLTQKKGLRSKSHPQLSISEINDPILKKIWSSDRQNLLEKANIQRSYTGEDSFVELINSEFVFIYQYVRGYTSLPLIIGSYFPYDEIGQQVNRLEDSLIYAIILIFLFISLVFFLGKKISTPIKNLSQSAIEISKLKLDNTSPLKKSIFSEINDASNAFNTMLAGLKSLDKYVPKTIVLRLMKLGHLDNLKSEIRDITVLFTDIASFTAIAEQSSTQDIEEFLNEYFSVITACIEEEGGTVDKFVGDMVMAFWGAPYDQKDQADLACKASLKIYEKLHHYNLEREKQKKVVIKTRIGIHSGSALVGNIGSKTRVNYTAIGDTVNVAEKLQEFGKLYLKMTGQDIVISVSNETKSQTTEKFKFSDTGKHKIGNRDQEIKVFHLLK